MNFTSDIENIGGSPNILFWFLIYISFSTSKDMLILWEIHTTILALMYYTKRRQNPSNRKFSMIASFHVKEVWYLQLPFYDFQVPIHFKIQLICMCMCVFLSQNLKIGVFSFSYRGKNYKHFNTNLFQSYKASTSQILKLIPLLDMIILWNKVRHARTA